MNIIITRQPAYRRVLSALSLSLALLPGASTAEAQSTTSNATAVRAERIVE